MYGLNPSITNSNHLNSPFHESPCDFCKSKCTRDCEYYSDPDDDKMPEDEMFDDEAMNEMYAEIY